MQKPCHLGSKRLVWFVQRIQQQDVADVQHIGVQIVPVDIVFAESRICAAIVVKRALFADRVPHDRGKRRQPLAQHAGGVDVIVFMQFFEHIVALRIRADSAQRGQR